MFHLLILRSRQAILGTFCQVTRAIHEPSVFDPVLKSRDNLPIIKMPVSYRGNLKKIKRSIRFEESMAAKKAKMRNKQ